MADILRASNLPLELLPLELLPLDLLPLELLPELVAFDTGDAAAAEYWELELELELEVELAPLPLVRLVEMREMSKPPFAPL